MVKEKLDKIPGIKTNTPAGAFYIFPDVSDYFGKTDGEITIKDSYDLSMFILNKAYVSIVDGTAFGEPNCIRMSFAASDENLTEAIDRIEKALLLLK
jgi:aspartate aminotransferase